MQNNNLNKLLEWLLEVEVGQVGWEGPLAFFLDDYNQDDHQVPDRG